MILANHLFGGISKYFLTDFPLCRNEWSFPYKSAAPIPEHKNLAAENMSAPPGGRLGL